MLKNIPLVDFGTGHKRHSTKSKKIALGYAKKFFNQNNKKAIDLGCGDGYWTEKLKKIGYEVVSVDSEKNHEDCQTTDLEKTLPFPANSFNLCWFTDVIEHLEDPEKILKEIDRILDGKLILITNNSYFWLYSFFKIFGLTAKDLQRQDHKHFFHYNDIKKLLPDAQVYGFFPYAILKFKIKNPWMIKWLSPSLVAISQTPLK